MGKLLHREGMCVGTPLRDVLCAILDAGLMAIDTKEAIVRRVRVDGELMYIDGRSWALPKGKLYVLGAGKCSGDALVALRDVLGDRITVGFVIDVAPRYPSGTCEVAVGDHPFSSERNILHTAKLLSMLQRVTADDLVLFIISGGGSALLAQPPHGISIADEVSVVKTLFKAGARIHELNTFRKHISYARGGFLAAEVVKRGARALALVFSDVPGDDLSFISSGPTVLDTTSVHDAITILDRYGATDITCQHIKQALIETPKDETHFSSIEHILFMNNVIALRAMAATAITHGFSPIVIDTALEGDAQIVGQRIAGDITNAASKTCLLYGGETTVRVEGSGAGGRNRHVALSALPMVDEGCLIAAIASDGVDNGPSAGAFADSVLLQYAHEKGVDPWRFIKNSDSQGFFDALGTGTISTGPTGSNVADLIVALRD